jgi:hypothetical protein
LGRFAANECTNPDVLVQRHDEWAGVGLAAALYREFDTDEYERIIEPVDRTSLASHCLT